MANNQDSQDFQDSARAQALAQVASIVGMIAAYDCDFDRLRELRDERESLVYDVELYSNDPDEMQKLIVARSALRDWEQENGEELAELESAAGDCKDQDDAKQLILEDVLCVEYRSGWTSDKSEFSADEFRILLCTGGPHVEIMGEIDHNGEPSRCWIVYSGWGTNGTLYAFEFDQATILRYCGFFIVGE
jgi:hypothetical protein